MNNLVKAGNEDISVVEWKGQRVITTALLAEAYETSVDNVKMNFNRNKENFIEGKHYFLLQGEDLREFKSKVTDSYPVKSNVNQLYLWTERGANRHCKILDTDKAWEQFDNLEETYFKVNKSLSQIEMMRIQLGMIDNHEERIVNLENNTTIDYGQQRVLEETVNKTVIGVLGGKGSNAYKKIGRKVFAECNHDLKSYFNVNARNNIPKRRFDEAVEYAKNWKPCTNTQMLINDYNAQMTL